MVLTMFAGVAEFERALIRHRTDEGRQASWGVIWTATEAPPGSEDPRPLTGPGRQVHQRGRTDLQRPHGNHPSLPQRFQSLQSKLMTVHRTAQTHGPVGQDNNNAKAYVVMFVK